MARGNEDRRLIWSSNANEVFSSRSVAMDRALDLVREAERSWLSKERDRIERLLTDGSYLKELPPTSNPRGPVALHPLSRHPKSPAQRIRVEQNRPLTKHERRDSATMLSIIQHWLTVLEGADRDTLELIHEAILFAQASARTYGDLLDRMHAPDKEDASRQRTTKSRQSSVGRQNRRGKLKVMNPHTILSEYETALQRATERKAARGLATAKKTILKKIARDHGGVSVDTMRRFLKRAMKKA